MRKVFDTALAEIISPPKQTKRFKIIMCKLPEEKEEESRRRLVSRVIRCRKKKCCIPGNIPPARAVIVAVIVSSFIYSSKRRVSENKLQQKGRGKSHARWKIGFE